MFAFQTGIEVSLCFSEEGSSPKTSATGMSNNFVAWKIMGF
jgi:hypothetical protein